MKISAREGDKGFRYMGPHRYRVLMDGRPLERVHRVDTATGVAWVSATDQDGQPYLVGDEIAERRVFGPMRLEQIQ